MALAPSVHAVVVTHGDNQSLASRVADALLEQAAVRTLILVANGLAWDLGAWAAARPHGRVEVVEMERNRGSAAAYAAGITRARALGAELVWLFDHDNLPAPSALQELLAAYDRLSARFPRDSLAVAAYRPQQYPGVVAGVPARRWNRRRSSFLGFHIFDLPFLLWRRAPWRRVRVPPAPPAEVEVAAATFGGLLFHMDLVARHGLPREDFVLYADDSEFSFRIVRAGGAIRLITSARVEDVDASWYVRRPGNSLRRWLQEGSDLQVFYSARNRAYLDEHVYPHHWLMHRVNRMTYCLLLRLFSLALGTRRRYRLLRQAVADGRAARLGVSPGYPLPQTRS